MEFGNTINMVEDLAYVGENLDTRREILAAIRRLPVDAKRFALDRCTFTSVGHDIVGMTLPGRIGVHSAERRSRNVWIIVVLDQELGEEFQTTIAHEIAHAWLGHDRCGELPDDCEEQAAKLAKSWGFTGHGADEEKARARDREATQ